MTNDAVRPPPGANAALALADGSVFWGQGLGAVGSSVGELCFNTSITGYQEILTDPSYAGQIITFTFPHIGNIGANGEDIETITPSSRGLVLAASITEPSNWRATRSLDNWLVSVGLSGIAGVDTRRLTRRLRDLGATNAALIHQPDGQIDIAALIAKAAAWPGLDGMDLAIDVTGRLNGPGTRPCGVWMAAMAVRPTPSIMSWRSITAPNGIFCARWPPPVAGSPSCRQPPASRM